MQSLLQGGGSHGKLLNLIYPCLFLPLYVAQFPFILPYPFFSANTHEQSLSLAHIRKYTQTNTTLHAPLFLCKHYHSAISSSIVSHACLYSLSLPLCHLCVVPITQYEFITENRFIVSTRIASVVTFAPAMFFCLSRVCFTQKASISYFELYAQLECVY